MYRRSTLTWSRCACGGVVLFHRTMSAFRWVCAAGHDPVAVIVRVGRQSDINLCVQDLAATTVHVLCFGAIAALACAAASRRARYHAAARRLGGRRKDGGHAPSSAAAARGRGLANGHRGGAGLPGAAVPSAHAALLAKRWRGGRDDGGEGGRGAGGVSATGASGSAMAYRAPLAAVAVCIMASASLAAGLSRGADAADSVASRAFSPAAMFALGTGLLLWLQMLGVAVVRPTVAASWQLAAACVLLGCVGAMRLRTCVLSAEAGLWKRHFAFWTAESVCCGFATLVGVAGVAVCAVRAVKAWYVLCILRCAQRQQPAHHCCATPRLPRPHPRLPRPHRRRCVTKLLVCPTCQPRSQRARVGQPHAQPVERHSRSDAFRLRPGCRHGGVRHCGAARVGWHGRRVTPRQPRAGVVVAAPSVVLVAEPTAERR